MFYITHHRPTLFLLSLQRSDRMQTRGLTHVFRRHTTITVTQELCNLQHCRRSLQIKATPYMKIMSVRPSVTLSQSLNRFLENSCKWPTWRTIVLFYNTFITVLYIFRPTSCSSSEGQIVLIQHLVSSLSVSGRPVVLFWDSSRTLCSDQHRLLEFSKWPTWRTTLLFCNTFITVLYIFRATSCLSSWGQIVLIQHLVWSLSISGRSLLTCASDGHL